MERKPNKVLHLPLKKEWYQMIESGAKTEEYRQIKPYWEIRLLDYKALKEDDKSIAFKRHVLYAWTDPHRYYPKGYAHVTFSYGYTKRTMTFEIKNIRIGKGRTDWGAPDEDVFIIELGERILKP